jgi:hypothetical protein
MAMRDVGANDDEYEMDMLGDMLGLRGGGLR